MKYKDAKIRIECDWCGKGVYDYFNDVCFECWDTVKELVIERRLKKLLEENK